ncbi:T7SS effector LXG polymorphic toxin, partial [Bacillus paralicheniformis]|nr:T7SS effector LXG polymorphic toxin [Bacillus paralicheniformis]
LEHELEHGLNAADRTTKHLVSKANATMAKVSHIVDLPDLNDNDFHEQNRKAMKEINQTIEKLHTFDREQTNALKTTENDLETMQKYISRLEKMYTGPKIEITSYQKGSILKTDQNDKINGLAGGLPGEMENAEPSPMEIMLEKLEKTDRSNVDTVIKDENKEKVHQDIHANDAVLTELQKEAAKHPKVYGDIRVIDGKLYNHKGWKEVKTIDVADEVVEDTSDINYIGGRYHVYENGQIVRKYISNGKVKMEVVDSIPNSRSDGNSKVLDSEFEGTPLEALGYVNLGNATRTLGKKAIKKVEKATQKALKNKVQDVKKVIAERSKSLDLNEHPTKTKQFSSKKMKELKERIDNRTITKQEYQDYIWNKKFAKKRKAGVTEFWDMEAERIMNGEPTTRNWSQKQIQDILSGKVPKYNGKPMAGHHTYSASKYPHLSDQGEIIYPATFNEHFNGWHGGNWKNSKPGEPIKSIRDF